MPHKQLLTRLLICVQYLYIYLQTVHIMTAFSAPSRHTLGDGSPFYWGANCFQVVLSVQNSLGQGALKLIWSLTQWSRRSRGPVLNFEHCMAFNVGTAERPDAVSSNWALMNIFGQANLWKWLGLQEGNQCQQLRLWVIKHLLLGQALVRWPHARCSTVGRLASRSVRRLLAVRYCRSSLLYR